MSVKIVSNKKNGDEYALLPTGKPCEHFKIKEFRCKDGSDEIKYSPETVAFLENIRAHFGGKSITINSAYRTATYNKKIGGASKSQHVVGTACDIVISGVTPLAIAQYAEGIGVNGIGVYKTFTHIDSRSGKSRWDNRSGREVVVSGFGGKATATTKTEEQKMDEKRNEQAITEAKTIIGKLGKYIDISDVNTAVLQLADNYNNSVWWILKKVVEKLEK